VTVRLGRRDVDARIDRFIHTASQVIAHRLTEVNYVDMRYSMASPSAGAIQARRRRRRPNIPTMPTLRGNFQRHGKAF